MTAPGPVDHPLPEGLAALRLRPLASVDEIRAAVDLEQAVWQAEERDLVPVTEIVAARENGGIVLGAWEGERLVGFVFSMVGRRDGRIYQYSRMLAVDPAWRGRGLGAELKLAQKREALARGDRWMEWTFDPLEARNAALNLRRLGARVSHYYRDFYGARTSRFDLGIPTDRFRAGWDLDEDLRRTGPGRRAAAEGAPVAFEVVLIDGRPRPGPVRVAPGWDRCLIPVPSLFQPIREASRDTALAWRMAVRQAAEAAFAAGLVVVDFEPAWSAEPPLGAHVLLRADR